MTFDDFKQQFEIFGKLDTPKKLAICESQYEEHLLHTEDEKYFEPTKEHLGDDTISDYEKKLNDILLFDKIQDKQFYFLVKPSFEPENLLILEQRQSDYSLTHVVLAKNYWSVFYANNKIIDIEKITLKSELNKPIGDKLFAVLNKTIIDARQPKASFVILDGVVYSLSKLFNGQQKTVSKHSPSETSKSGKIIEIMQQLIDNIENIDEAILLSIEKKIINLQD